MCFKVYVRVRVRMRLRLLTKEQTYGNKAEWPA